jgi:LuxR family maltose regulon positive regulatory protein
VNRLLTVTAGTGTRASIAQELVEPLSERELDVLRLLGSDLGGPDIARELSVSLNTLRTHTKNIYAKLGVTSRRAAVRQARDLNLIRGQRPS